MFFLPTNDDINDINDIYDDLLISMYARRRQVAKVIPNLQYHMAHAQDRHPL